MNQELGTFIGEQQVSEILEKITSEGTKISKSELAHIFFWLFILSLYILFLATHLLLKCYYIRVGYTYFIYNIAYQW